MRRNDSGAFTLLETFSGTFNLALIAAALALAAVSGYYIYGAMAHGDQLFRGLGPDGKALAPQDYARHLQHIELLTRVLTYAAIVGAVSAMARFYDRPEAGIVLLVMGGALAFGMPFMLDQFGGEARKLPAALLRLGVEDPRGYLKSQFTMAGMMLGGTGLAQLLFHTVLLVATARERRPRVNVEAAKVAAQNRKPNDRFLGPCWSLPFCRDTDKKLCPVRTGKRACWRTGRGCYCDQNILLALTGGNQYAASRGSMGYQATAAAMITRPRSLAEKRAQCLQCPIYLHHQGHKYKLLVPLALISSIGGLAFNWEQIRSAYPDLMLSAGRALSGFSFGAKAGQVPQWATDLATNSSLMWIILVVLGVLLVSYLLHAVEWVLYRLGL